MADLAMLLVRRVAVEVDGRVDSEHAHRENERHRQEDSGDSLRHGGSVHLIQQVRQPTYNLNL